MNSNFLRGSMTDQEKFYKLGLNILNQDYKLLTHIEGKIYKITVMVSADKLSLCRTSTGSILYEYRTFENDERLCCIYEEDPSDIDYLINNIKNRTYKRDDILDDLR